MLQILVVKARLLRGKWLRALTVLVGGALTSNGNNTTAGATFAGLNYLLGGNPAASSDDSDANGQKTYVYNSCNVEKASKGLQAYKTWNNTYIDVISAW